MSRRAARRRCPASREVDAEGALRGVDRGQRHHPPRVRALLLRHAPPSTAARRCSPPLRREVAAEPLAAGDLVAASALGALRRLRGRSPPAPGRASAPASIPPAAQVSAAPPLAHRARRDGRRAARPGTPPATLRDAWLATGEPLPAGAARARRRHRHGAARRSAAPSGPTPSDADPLQAGATLVVQGYVWEPGVGGYLGADTVLVTDDGPVTLSRMPDGPLAEAARTDHAPRRRPRRRRAARLRPPGRGARRSPRSGSPRKGYASTSTRDIAEACGMLPGSLYSHFRSKGEILQLVLTPFLEQLARRAACRGRRRRHRRRPGRGDGAAGARAVRGEPGRAHDPPLRLAVPRHERRARVARRARQHHPRPVARRDRAAASPTARCARRSTRRWRRG